MHQLLKFDVIWNKDVPSCDNLSIMKKKKLPQFVMSWHVQ